MLVAYILHGEGVVGRPVAALEGLEHAAFRRPVRGSSTSILGVGGNSYWIIDNSW
jgi:hypothetical protein